MIMKLIIILEATRNCLINEQIHMRMYNVPTFFHLNVCNLHEYVAAASFITSHCWVISVLSQYVINLISVHF